LIALIINAHPHSAYGRLEREFEAHGH
jgi:hypothetical protein